ncbi:polyamine aminopropyltransferase [Melghirimyces algeriensis]|uniref:Polyamine aminopropyltransferase n=1 Tax=Melghirimyces algeriensis TaxID=910412 RepID=A0A521CI37_9BACL|nr:polyamine aminopropyltransferase [Melghirimyces algeriensis]SMO59117.1 spermidine synthase [Melghirimyces algeriensis]
MENTFGGQGFFKDASGTLWLSDPEERFGFRSTWKVNQVLCQVNSAFQEVAVVETEGFGKALVLDGIVQTTEKDGFIYNEMISHIPLATHPHPQDICIIGGGDCGVAREAVKYPSVRNVDMVEIDPVVVEVSRKYLPEVAGEGELDPRVQLHYEDGTLFIRNQSHVYDAVIVDSSDPVGPGAVLFEKDFYEDVYHSLKEDGLMVCQSESPVFHPDVLTRVHQSLKELFPVVRTYLATVPTYPGGIWSFTVASKSYDPLQEGRERLQLKDNRYVNREIFDACFQLPVYVRELLK